MAETSAAEFQRLTERRDLSAYNCVNAIRDVLNFFEAQDFEQSRQMLQDALDLHKDADRTITEFHVRNAVHLKKENSHVSASATNQTRTA